MSHHVYSTSRPDAWNSPRPFCDETLRQQGYGRVRPMHHPSWLERIFGA